MQVNAHSHFANRFNGSFMYGPNFQTAAVQEFVASRHAAHAESSNGNAQLRFGEAFASHSAGWSPYSGPSALHLADDDHTVGSRLNKQA